jgi:hypothetical protein
MNRIRHLANVLGGLAANVLVLALMIHADRSLAWNGRRAAWWILILGLGYDGGPGGGPGGRGFHRP